MIFVLIIKNIIYLQYIRIYNIKVTMISNELLKGSVKTILLKVLKENGPMHGYAITQKVEELSDGKIKLTYGGLYPLLHKLENDGILVTASEIFNNRIRVYYALTDKGESVVLEKLRELNEYIESIKKIIDTKPGLSHV
jgi:PadR family transcriptional regulator PadR